MFKVKSHFVSIMAIAMTFALSACGGGGGGPSSNSSSSSSASLSSMKGAYTFTYGFRGVTYTDYVNIGASNGTTDPSSGNPIYTGADGSSNAMYATYCPSCNITYNGVSLPRFIWSLYPLNGYEVGYIFRIEGDGRLTGAACLFTAGASQYSYLPTYNGDLSNQDNCAILNSSASFAR